MKTLGKYEIQQEIGRGGFAVVYEARDTILERIVALKVLHPHWTADPDFVDRFHREARIAANLSQRNIVIIHAAGKVDGQLYIEMEYLPGHTLHKLLEAEGALSLERALPILDGLAKALDYAHKRGVVHRDVKPNNIIVQETERGLRVKLTDFGLVKAMEGSSALTSQGTLLGSPEYMAPEQADPERAGEIGPATDHYALGVVAYQMLTGRVPFPGNTPATLNAHLNLPPPDPRSIRRDLSPPVAEALLKMLSKTPADRFDTTGAFVARLREAWAVETQIGEQEVQTDSVAAEEQQRHKRRHIEVAVPTYTELAVPPGIGLGLEETKRGWQLVTLKETLERHFSQGELRDLCFAMGIDYERLPQTKGDFARELVAFCKRRGLLLQLILTAKRQRPNIPWPDTSAIAPQEAQLVSLYERLQVAVSQRDWPEVLALGGRIQALAPDYKDVSALMEQAKAHLRPVSSPQPDTDTLRKLSLLPGWIWTGAIILLMVVLFLGAQVMGIIPFSEQPTRTPDKKLTETPTRMPAESPTEKPVEQSATHTPTPTPSHTPSPTSPPTLTPSPTPTFSPTPTSTSTPTFTPRPIRSPTTEPYPPPVLEGIDIIGCNVTFKWNWSRNLAEDEYFEVRVGRGNEQPSRVQWTKGSPYTYTLSDAGGYSWEIAICRGDSATSPCEQLAASGQSTFEFKGGDCAPEPPTPTPA